MVRLIGFGGYWHTVFEDRLVIGSVIVLFVNHQQTAVSLDG